MALGWKAQSTTEEGFERLVQWYRANRTWASGIIYKLVMNSMDPYESRPLTAGYPTLEVLGVQHYAENQNRETQILEVLRCVSKLIDLSSGARTVCVLGCGPRPEGIRKLVEAGYEVTGVEPVEGSATAAREFASHVAVIVSAGRKPCR